MLQAQKFETLLVTIRGDWKLPWLFTSVSLCSLKFLLSVTGRRVGVDGGGGVRGQGRAYDEGGFSVETKGAKLSSGPLVCGSSFWHGMGWAPPEDEKMVEGATDGRGL